MQQSKNFHYRYERKYVSSDYSSHQLRNFLLLSNRGFTRIYYKRRVNSIYFDTPEFEYFEQNINGDQDRRKVRVRWYGEQSSPRNLQLEIKIKCGEIMRKEVFPLSCQDSNLSSFIKKLTSLVQKELSNKLEEAQVLRPVLINSYWREYFYSPGDKIRVTLDDDIEFQSISDFIHKRVSQRLAFSILECKYTLRNDRALQAVLQTLPVQISKSSKYVMGIEQTYSHLMS